MAAMSRTSGALAKIDALLPLFTSLPASGERQQLIDEAEALRRAVAAFHMEAIRFRMYSVERLLRGLPVDESRQRLFDELRHELETAGFHTRSHSAP
jgi:hypothetical protein